MIDTLELKAVFTDCLFEDSEVLENHIRVDGIMMDVLFHRGRVEENKEQISSWLAQLPDAFHFDKGGGMSFLNACVTQSGEHWGEHPAMEQLFILGMAAGYVTCLSAREHWSSFPGGMPYYQVNLSN